MFVVFSVGMVASNEDYMIVISHDMSVWNSRLTKQ